MSLFAYYTLRTKSKNTFLFYFLLTQRFVEITKHVIEPLKTFFFFHTPNSFRFLKQHYIVVNKNVALKPFVDPSKNFTLVILTICPDNHNKQMQKQIQTRY